MTMLTTRVRVAGCVCVCWLLLSATAALTSGAASASGASSPWDRVTALWAQEQWAASLAVLDELAPTAEVATARGVVAHELGDWDAAREHYNAALALTPDDPTALGHLGKLHFDLGQPHAAVACFERALAVDPTRRSVLAHPLAVAYHHTGDFGRAERSFRQAAAAATTQTPLPPAFHFDLGVTLEKLGRILDAADAYNTALRLDPSLAAAWLNVAALHHQYGDVNASVPCYERVLSLPTASPSLRLMAMTNLGIAHEQLRDVDQALRWFDRAEALVSGTSPTTTTTMTTIDALEDTRLSLLAHRRRAKRTACQWDDFESAGDRLLALVVTRQLHRGRRTALLPFDTLLDPMASTLRLELARHYTQGLVSTGGSAAATATDDNDDNDDDGGLRVGYLSYDFADHPTLHLLEGLLVARDRSRVGLVAFGYGRDDGSAARRRLPGLVDEFVNLADASLAAGVAAIRARRLDVLMDAQGHTRGGRPGLAAARPAPVVVNYLVYPGTSGAPYTDYVVADRHVTPPDAIGREALSERRVLLPSAYQVNHYAEPPPESRATLWDASAGAEPPFTFVNWNKIDKLEPGVFGTWLGILRRVPGSRLLLLDPATAADEPPPTSRAIRANLWREAAARGIAAERLTFVPRVVKATHLRRHRLAGLFLDTFVYGAHSTATDALYAGVPVLTLAGDAFASRVGVSLLRNVDLGMLVTSSRKEYEDLAVLIATTRHVHAGLRLTLRRRLGPLFRTREHVRGLEEAQRVMATLARAGHCPWHLVIGPFASHINDSSSHDDPQQQQQQQQRH